MNALAVIFRLLSMFFSVAGLAAFLWITSETKKTQKNEFLDEQVEMVTKSCSQRKRVNGIIFLKRKVLSMKFLKTISP